jgi:hypothetical protein
MHGVVASFELVLIKLGGWSRIIQGVIFFFRLEPVNQGVGASFQLVLENIGSHSFFLVGANKIRGLEPPSSWSWRNWGIVASFRLEPHSS